MKHVLLVGALVVAAGCAKAPDAPIEAPPPSPKPTPAFAFKAPAPWKQEEPANKLRKFQYSVPDKQKDHADAECVVFYFGASAAPIQQNIRRWADQMRADAPNPQAVEGKHKITLVDLAGTYAGDAGGDPIESARMLAAVVEHPDGPWYFKLVGPAETVGDWREEFVALLKAAQ